MPDPAAPVVAEPVAPVAPVESAPVVPVVPVETPAAAPAVETPPAAPVAPTERVKDYAAELRDARDAAKAALTATVEEPAPAAPATPAPEVVPAAPVVPAEVAPVEVDPNAPPVVPPVEKPADELPEPIERPRFKDPRDQLIAGMKKAHPDWSWAKCEEQVDGPAPAEPVVAEVADPLAEELEQVVAQLDEAAASGALMTPELRKLQRRESEILAKQAAKEAAAPLVAKEAAREKQAFDTDRAASITAAESNFPTLYQDGTPLNTKAREIYTNMQNPEHPDYFPGIKGKANSPEIVAGRALNALADEISARDGISFADAYATLKGNAISVQPAKAAAQPKPAPTVTPARKPPVTAPGNLATRTPDRPKTQAEIDTELAAMDPLDRYEAFFGRRPKIG